MVPHRWRPKGLRVLVTGGAGFIGSHLVDALAPANDVTVVDNCSTGHPLNVPPSVQFVRLDVRRLAQKPHLIKGRDCIFHVAAVPSVPRSVRDPVGAHDNNATGTVAILEAARRHDVPRVVYSASSSAYGDGQRLPKREDMVPRPLSPYAASKLAGEGYLAAYAHVYGLRGFSLRYFNVYGPRQDPNSPYAALIPRFVRAALKSQPLPIHGDGRQTRDFTYVDDAVQANLRAATAPGARGQVVNVAGGRRVSVLRLVRLLESTLGRRLAVRHLAARAGDVHDSWADLRLARKLLRYGPTVPLKEGLARVVASMSLLQGNRRG